MFSVNYKLSGGQSYIYFGGYETTGNITWYDIVTNGTYAGYWTLAGKTIKYGS